MVPIETYNFLKERNLFLPKIYSFLWVLQRHLSSLSIISPIFPIFPSTLGPFSPPRNHLLHIEIFTSEVRFLSVSLAVIQPEHGVTYKLHEH